MSVANRVMAVAGLALAGFAGYKVRLIKDENGLIGSPVNTLLASTQKDVEIGEVEYYNGIIELLDAKYVDKMPAPEKLLSGAVRGMVTSLRDAESQFYNPQEFAAFKSLRAGQYTGIGVWLDYKSQKVDLKLDGEDGEAMLPRLTVVSVAPGSPADKAGVRAGDFLDSVDGHWVTNSEAILRYRKAQMDYLNKKIDFKTINDMRKALKAKADKSILPGRAREKLIVGNSGEISVVWERDGKPVETKLTKGMTEVSQTVGADGTITLPFISGAAEGLANHLKGKTSVTIDLRNNVLGDYETMRKCLALLAPAGTYGYFETSRKGVPLELKINKGATTAIKVKLIVDESTRDVAEIFALALSSKGIATLSGGAMGGSHNLKEVTQLPDGSGYTLNLGKFKRGKLPETRVAENASGVRA